MIKHGNQQFYELVKNIIYTPEFKEMAKYRHHINTSIYDHSLKVAYLCYCYHRKHKCNINIKELVHAALLHDYFLYDRIGKSTANRPRNRFVHVFVHPSIAQKNACRKYRLTKAESNAIKRHMFPIIPIPPTTQCGWIICWYDKIASIGDYINSEKWKKSLKKSHPQIFVHTQMY